MTDRWRATLESLRDSFQSIAVRSGGVFHVMIEQQQIPTDSLFADPEPNEWKRLADRGPNFMHQFCCLPGDPPHIRGLTPEESVAAPAPQEKEPFFRDLRGVAHAVLEPAIIRNGLLCGEQIMLTQFRTLAEAAGRIFRGLPPDVLAMFPATLGGIPRMQFTIQRRHIFGEVTGPRPPWLAQGWEAAVVQFEKGVLIDVVEAGSGSSDGADLWVLILHRLGWLGDRNSLVVARRYFWHGNHTVGYDLVQNRDRDEVPSPFSAAIESVPKHRFFSVFGSNQSEHTDLCWASKWAIDELLALSAAAVPSSEKIRDQLRKVEEADNKKSKGAELEQLMKLLFNSVYGFCVRDSNVRTKTEEIDLVLDNKCRHHPWNREKALVLVECKNWSKPAGKNEIAIFENKIKNRRGRCTIGFFIAWNGFARTVEKHLLRSSQDSWMIVPLTGVQIKSAIDTGGFTELLDSAWYDALKI